jgi:DNA topoisomerase-1
LGTFRYYQRENKIELSKDVDATKLTLEEVQEKIAKKTPTKKVAAKKAPAEESG